MLRITKVKVAGVVAAGALTLGAAGAYAAGNANNTITVNGQTKTVTFNGLSLTALPGAPALPTTQFKNQGECVSWFAEHKQFALTTNGGLTTSGGSTQLAKNYHGKLMSQIGAACKAGAASATTSDSSTPATTKKSTPETEATETETETGDKTETETGDKTETETVDKTESSEKADKAGSHGHSEAETND